MAEHDGHRERLRQRAKAGLEDFQPHEVLELMLCYAIPRKNVNPLAHALMARFGSLSAVLDAKPEELMQVEGIGESAAVFLTTLLALCRAYQRDRWGEKPRLSSRKAAGEYCTALFGRQQVESMQLLCLDTHKCVTATETLATGTVDETPLYTRAVVECALRHHAHSVILVHNHPSGVLKPSPGDIAVTQTVRQALAVMEIELLDHMIVAGERYVSLNDLGLLNAPRIVSFVEQERAADEKK